MNVNLWFARDKDDEIVGILNSNNDKEYTCPICSSKVIPKALESKKMSPHFAHVDKEKCSSESMLHFWFKHKFIEHGDTFTIVADKEYTYTCKDFKTEVTFNLESGTYRPDIVIETECGNEIVFEMANTNKKKVQDYIDRWIELDKIVVEVDIKALQNENEVKEFKALYYYGKCFNFNKQDGGYYNAIGKLKEEMKLNDNYDIELVKKLDWFWNEICKYENDEIVDIDEIHLYLSTMTYEYFEVVKFALRNRKSKSIIRSYIQKLVEEREKERLNILKSIEVKYVNKEYINEILTEGDIEYKALSVVFSYGNYNIEYINSFNEKFTLEFKITDLDEPKIKRRIANLHNRMAYKEIEYNLKSTIKELNNKYETVRFVLSYERDGFSIESKLAKQVKRNTIYYAKYRYDEMYNYVHLFRDTTILKSKLIKETITDMITCKCVTCKDNFSISLGEYLYFKEKDLDLPKRCKLCRKERKEEKLNEQN